MEGGMKVGPSNFVGVAEKRAHAAGSAYSSFQEQFQLNVWACMAMVSPVFTRFEDMPERHLTFFLKRNGLSP